MAKLTKPNWVEARQFAELIAGKPDSVVTIQVFDDATEKDRRLAKCRVGKLSDTEIQKWLITKIKAGCGIFLTVNECDGKGRRTENVLKARASFVDLDKTGLPAAWELHPDIIVESSPGKYWAFWLIEPTLDLRAWSDCQARLAAFYGGDKTVTDAPRVSRWPGFDHQKKSPFRTHIIESISVEAARLGSFSRRTLKEIAAAHPCDYKKPVKIDAIAGRVYRASANDFVYARHFARHAPISIEDQEGDNNALSVAHRMLDYGLLPVEAFEELQEWNERCEPPFSDSELKKICNNAGKYRQTPIGCKTLEATADEFKE